MFHANTYLSSLNIDLHSDDADVSINDGHKIFNLKERVRVPRNCHALIGVSSFHCLYGFYMFREGINNSFKITIDSITETISIGQGNYSINELVTSLNTALTTANLTFLLTSLSINVNYTTNKLYFKTVPDKAITISDNLAWAEMGYDDGIDIAYPIGQTHYATHIFNLAGDPSVYIRLQNQSLENINTKNIQGVLTSVYVPCMFGEYFFHRPNEIQYFRSSLDLTKFDISILDQYMREISVFNTNAPWQITFTVHFSYNKEVKLDSRDLINFDKNALLSDNIDEEKKK